MSARISNSPGSLVPIPPPAPPLLQVWNPQSRALSASLTFDGKDLADANCEYYGGLNTTESVRVPSSQHVGEIVGKNGELC